MTIIHGANIGYVVKKQHAAKNVVPTEKSPEIFGANVSFTYKQKPRRAVENPIIIVVETQANLEPVIEKVPEPKMNAGWNSKREKKKSSIPYGIKEKE